MAKNVYEMITEKVIEQLEKGVAPWRKPWSFVKNADERRGDPTTAYRWSNGRAYGFVNQMILPAGAYITFKQAKENGGKIKKGAKTQLVFEYFHVPATKEIVKDAVTGEEETFTHPAHFALRYYPVFSVSDVEGLPAKQYNSDSDGADDDDEPIDVEQCYEDANACLTNYISREKIEYHEGSNEAYYVPSRDAICVPAKKQYSNIAEYYSTTFHEITHSTGHTSRLARKGITEGSFFGSQKYAQEELVAEMGAVMALANFGIDSSACFDNSCSYLQGWSKKLKEDPKMIVIASQQAENAVRFIISGEKKGAA